MGAGGCPGGGLGGGENFIVMEPYSGNPFVNKEMVPCDQRYICVRFYDPAMGVDFNWTFN